MSIRPRAATARWQGRKKAKKKKERATRLCALAPRLGYVLLIPVPVTPSVRMTLVHLGTSVISPFRVEARTIIIVVAPVMALSVRGTADANAETRSVKVNSLRQGRRRASSCNRAEDTGGDH
jgi:hypothetical protein